MTQRGLIHQVRVIAVTVNPQGEETLLDEHIIEEYSDGEGKQYKTIERSFEIAREIRPDIELQIANLSVAEEEVLKKMRNQL